METPDGKVFSKEEGPEKGRSRFAAFAAAAGAFVARAAGALGRAAWRVASIVLRAIGKFIITTWRLASALDSALWRAVKLLAGRFGEAAMHALALLGQVLHSLWLWLPTRAGRAYSAACGVWIIIAGLWMADELRAGSQAIIDTGESGRPPIDEDDPILARIGGRFVHLSEIERLAHASGAIDESEALTPDLAFERGLVETYVEQRLLAREARDEGLHRAPQVLRQVNAARDRILAASLINNRVNDEVTPDTVKRFYDAQRDITVLGDEVRARHILVETGEEAAEIIGLLKGGADFGTLARERSLDKATARYGGEIGWFAKGMMEPRLSKVAFATPVGEIAPPFQSEFGWHILEVEGRRPTSAKPFSEVSANIEEYLRLRLIDDTLKTLEDENQVIYYRPQTAAAPRALAPVLPGGPDDEDADRDESQSTVKGSP